MILSEEYITIHGAPARVLSGGKGSIHLLVLHGWGSTADRYRAVFATFAETDVSVLIPDQPGFGSTPPPPRAWGIADYVQWTRELLVAHAWEHCVILGHSFGGAVAIAFAATAPDRVTALVVYAARGISRRPAALRALIQMFAHTGSSLFALPVLRTFREIARRLLYRAVGSEDYLRAGVMGPTLQRVVAENIAPIAARVRVPTAILWGDADHDTPLRDAKRLKMLIPGAALVVVHGVGHAFHHDDPERFAAELTSILTTFP